MPNGSTDFPFSLEKDYLFEPNITIQECTARMFFSTGQLPDG